MSARTTFDIGSSLSNERVVTTAFGFFIATTRVKCFGGIGGVLGDRGGMARGASAKTRLGNLCEIVRIIKLQHSMSVQPLLSSSVSIICLGRCVAWLSSKLTDYDSLVSRRVNVAMATLVRPLPTTSSHESYVESQEKTSLV